MSDHAWAQEQIAAHVAGGLDAPEAERLEAHARECPDCAAALGDPRDLDRGLDSLLAPMKPAAALEDRMIRSVHVIKAADLSRRRWKRNLIWAVAASVSLGAYGAGISALTRELGFLPFPGDERLTVRRSEETEKHPTTSFFIDSSVDSSPGRHGGINQFSLADGSVRNTRSGIELPSDPDTGEKYKAMAIRTAPETIGGGLVLPGSRVDVVSVERQTNGKTVSSTVLQNVLVTGVDINTSRPDDSGYIKNAQTVTMAVKQTEGMVLALAQKRGDVFLMLRSPDDDKVNKNLKTLADYVPEPLAQREKYAADYEGKESTEVATTTQAQQEHKKLADQWGNLPEKERSGHLWKDFVPGEYRAKVDTGAALRSGSKTDPEFGYKLDKIATQPPAADPKPNAPPAAPALPATERKIIRTGDIEF